MNKMSYAGMTIHASVLATCPLQFRFPRSKAKRIRKKWAKDGRNFKRVPTSYLMNNNILIAHPEIVNAIRKKIDQEATTCFYGRQP